MINPNSNSKRACKRLHELGLLQFGQAPELCIRSPGRLEILGNHTDYNNGFALTCAIQSAIYIGLRAREDSTFRCFSETFPDLGIQSFELNSFTKNLSGTWIDYLKGIILELQALEVSLRGADIVIVSDLPQSGGISSSAALECGLAMGLSQLFKGPTEPFTLAKISQRAENNFVKSPCGFLDQAGVALSREDHFVFIDFQPDKQGELFVELIPAKLEKEGLSFVLAVDCTVSRQLASTGYPARRKDCEDSLPFWSDTLGKPITSLRQINQATLVKHLKALENFNPRICQRVHHVVDENQRVLDAKRELESGHVKALGQLMTNSGHSAIERYDLAEGVPQLRTLLDLSCNIPGVLGARNMGGGFSVLVLALVKKDQVFSYQEKLREKYLAHYPKAKLQFIIACPSDGTDIISFSEH